MKIVAQVLQGPAISTKLHKSHKFLKPCKLKEKQKEKFQKKTKFYKKTIFGKNGAPPQLLVACANVLTGPLPQRTCAPASRSHCVERDDRVAAPPAGA